MKITMKTWFSHLMFCMSLMLPLALTLRMEAQATARFVGAITAIDGNTLTVKPDSGELHKVEVTDSATIKRIAPGERDLTKAEALPFANLAVGDRVLVKLDPNAPAGKEQALQIVAVKQEDLALKQQKEREDWQRRGVGGLVKSVDPAAGVIVLTSGAGPTAKTVTVHVAKTSMLKRYAPASVSYEAALPAPIEAVHAGDQLRARGTKNTEGTEITAEEVISGTFRNISGVVGTLDAAASTITLKDLTTKKQVTILITKDSQMRRLPDRVAQMIALRLKGGSAAGAMQGSTGANSAISAAGAQHSGSGGGQGGGGQWGGQGGQAPDPSQILNRAPSIQIADLKKGDAVMLVSTDGASEVTAITLLAGVEPLLEAPAASQNLLASWSMNSGGGAEGAQ
jgi:ribosome maturation factor RimP